MVPEHTEERGFPRSPVIVVSAILGAALLLSGDIRLPVSLPPSALQVEEPALAAFVRPDADAPACQNQGVFVEDEDDDTDDLANAHFAPSIAWFGVGLSHALDCLPPRQGAFRASGRSPVLRC